MTEKNEQLEAGLASDLNRELYTFYDELELMQWLSGLSGGFLKRVNANTTKANGQKLTQEWGKYGIALSVVSA